MNIENLTKSFEKPLAGENIAIKTYRKLMSQRMAIHWGGITDPFSNIERLNQQKTSLQILKLFRQHQYPVIISTKSFWIKDEQEYIENITQNRNLIMQISLISLNNKLEKLESGTSIQARLDSIKLFSKTNRVIVRCQPYIPELDGKEGKELFVKTIAENGAKAMTLEFLKLSSFQNEKGKKVFDEISTILGYDIIKYYKFKGRVSGTDYEIKNRYKFPVIMEFKELCKKYGLEFYCADNAFRSFGDSCICCGIPADYEINSYKAQTSYALFIAKKKGFVKFSDIVNDDNSEYEKEFLGTEIGSWLNLGSSEKHIQFGKKTFREKLMFIWDNPRNPNNPARFFVDLFADGMDEEGHIIYKYKKYDNK